MGKKRKHRTAFQKANDQIEIEGRKQCMLAYASAGLALYRHWNKKTLAISRLFEISGQTWIECAQDNLHSMIQMCEQETGIEVQNGDGKSWRDLPYLNAEIDTGRYTNAQLVYMRHQQCRWIEAQVTACILLSLYRKWGFGPERCSRVYQQMRDIQAEFDMDGDRLRAECFAKTHIDVYDTFTRPRQKEA